MVGSAFLIPFMGVNAPNSQSATISSFLTVEGNSLMASVKPYEPRYEVLGSLGDSYVSKAEILDKLAFCESSGDPTREVLDTNGKMSRGIYQYQEETFKRYVKKYGLLPYAEDDEIMNFIYDAEFQRELTSLVLEEKNGFRNWLNCWIKLGY